MADHLFVANYGAAVFVTPDFAQHPWRPIERAFFADESSRDVVRVEWHGGIVLDAFVPWLFEQSAGLDPATREGTVDPGSLPDSSWLIDVSVDPSGALVARWADDTVSTVHPGWLYAIATDQHLPRAAIGDAVVWTATDFGEPPTFDGSTVLDDASVLEAWLLSLSGFGVGRLRATPADDDYMAELAARIGPIRGSNFGGVFTVESVADPDSTANTGLALGQHTDLPTRETPPGFQFLHCVENTVSGGKSRLADGLAVARAIEREHPDAYASLTTDEWVFANRAVDGDHRWIGPVIDLGSRRSPLTIRAFYPVRLAPHMPIADQPRAYEAMRVFSQVAHDPRFMITSTFEPGDLVGFDNRRILHGRDAFDPVAGHRRLRGCYIDHDDVYSRLRVLRRPDAPEPIGPATSTTPERARTP